MKKVLWCLLAVIFFFSCKKKENTPLYSSSTPVDTLPGQYGIPFPGVPDVKDIVMYEVNIRAFSAVDNFAGIEARLDSIKALGVNVIWLMPIYPVGPDNSPYCVQDCFLVNPEFGSLTDLQNFVAMAHTKGMAVILDWVTDGTSFNNIWITLGNKSWYILNAAV